MILRITEARVVGPSLLDLTFNDGASKTVDVGPLLKGHIFKSIADPVEFAKVTLDPVCGTVTWPNGADLAPEALHSLSPVKQAASTK